MDAYTVWWECLDYSCGLWEYKTACRHQHMQLAHQTHAYTQIDASIKLHSIGPQNNTYERHDSCKALGLPLHHEDAIVSYTLSGAGMI